jgi:hypothetical protein
VRVVEEPLNPERASNKMRTFGPPTLQLLAECKGRFADLLPVKAGGIQTHA